VGPNSNRPASSVYWISALNHHNHSPTTFTWTKNADDIFASIERSFVVDNFRNLPLKLYTQSYRIRCDGRALFVRWRRDG
jgi:hypothetical protein